jgi:hypothetical protein
MDIFAKKTNIEIKNRFITFDISELPPSIQTTGYLVVLDHIMNRLHRNIIRTTVCKSFLFSR